MTDEEIVLYFNEHRLAKLESYHCDVRAKGEAIIAEAERQGKQAIILAGRPYHLDNEINHGINKLLTSLGMAVLSEDSVFEKGNYVKVNVLNQWTYHARLYRAAEFATRHKNVDFVQLVSFGCGIDAITTDTGELGKAVYTDKDRRDQ